MKSAVVKSSIVLAGHKTSVSLEDAFWSGLKEIAASRVDDPKDALSQLNALVAEQRRRALWMTDAQAFTAVYEANPQLARQEREQNRPRPVVYGQ